VPLDRGVCTDVIIRAYRAALQLDLQQHVHEDMKSAFSAYPRVWGMTRPDPSIDHRRVPNLMVFFRRRGASLPVLVDPAAYQPGDIVTQMLPGNLPHILMCRPRPPPRSRTAVSYCKISADAREEDPPFAYPRRPVPVQSPPTVASFHLGAAGSSGAGRDGTFRVESRCGSAALRVWRCLSGSTVKVIPAAMIVGTLRPRM